jgi:hypothetical protein
MICVGCLLFHLDEADALGQILLILEGVALVGVGDPRSFPLDLLSSLLRDLILSVNGAHREQCKENEGLPH